MVIAKQLVLILPGLIIALVTLDTLLMRMVKHVQTSTSALTLMEDVSLVVQIHLDLITALVTLDTL